MKTIQILLCLSLFVVGRSQAQTSKIAFNLQVKSEKIQEVKLSIYDYKLAKMVELRTLRDFSPNEVYNMAFQISEPSIYSIRLNTGKKIRIAVEQNGTILLRLGDEIYFESNIAKISDFEQTIHNLNKQFFAGLINDYDKAIKENDQTKIEELEKMKDEILAEFNIAMENTVREMGPSALAYDALRYFDVHKNLDFLIEMTELFKDRYANSEMSKSLQTRIAKGSQVAIGHEAPFFTATDFKGTEISLDNYRGNYVLIDFWASWCRSCRVENPKFVAIHKEYADKRFDIVSVSIDSDLTSWKDAVEKDGLQWCQIIDTNLSIYNLYMLNSLPSNFLLNKEGKIIAKNINADQLSILLSNENWNKGD